MHWSRPATYALTRHSDVAGKKRRGANESRQQRRARLHSGGGGVARRWVAVNVKPHSCSDGQLATFNGRKKKKAYVHLPLEVVRAPFVWARAALPLPLLPLPLPVPLLLATDATRPSQCRPLVLEEVKADRRVSLVLALVHDCDLRHRELVQNDALHPHALPRQHPLLKTLDRARDLLNRSEVDAARQLELG